VCSGCGLVGRRAGVRDLRWLLNLVCNDLGDACYDADLALFWVGPSRRVCLCSRMCAALGSWHVREVFAGTARV
jgi:hypothetical protein